MDFKETIKALKESRSLIDVGWIQKWFSVDDKENPIPPSEKSRKWSLDGAIHASNDDKDELFRCFMEVCNTLNPGHPYTNQASLEWIVRNWNDKPRRTKQEVLTVLDETITRLANKSTNLQEVKKKKRK